jgi:ketosteroid isomerase-like protein
MKDPALLIVLTACALALPGCQKSRPAESAQSAPALTDADREAIRRATAKFDQQAVAGDWAGATAIYSDDAILLPPNRPELRGRDTIRKFFEGFPKLAQFKEQVEQIQGDENLAYPEGSFELSFTPPGAKSPVKDKGKVLAVWHKQADGNWQVRRVIWNSDLPAQR